MKAIVRFLQLVYFGYATLLFLVLMIPVFVFALIVSSFGRIRGGNLIYRACMLWGDIWFPLIGIFHKNIYEQEPAPDKAYIFVANHISWLDAALIMKVFRKPLRPLGKVEMGRIPI